MNLLLGARAAIGLDILIGAASRIVSERRMAVVWRGECVDIRGLLARRHFLR